MNEEYIIGRISVMFAGFQKEIVQLDFKVQGRMATIVLETGDLIEIIDQEPVMSITTDEILDSYEKQGKKHESYEGRKVRVKLNPNATRRIREKSKKNAMNQLFKCIEGKTIKSSEAAEIYERIDKMYGEDDVLE